MAAIESTEMDGLSLRPNAHRMDSQFFGELNLETLKKLARGWAEKYPVMKKVTLYRGRERQSFKYALIVTVPDEDQEGFDFFVKKNEILKERQKLERMEPRNITEIELKSRLIKKKDKALETLDLTDAEGKAQFKRFREWTSGGENCAHVVEDLKDAYEPPLEKDDERFKHEWAWFKEPENAPLNEFVISESRCILYERKEGKRINEVEFHGKKLRPSQRHKMECRKVAERLWKENPKMTIADICHHNDINRIFDGKVYAEKTIRNWIKDLCPNRRAGRRPKAK
jgi:hypothetical protein